MSVDDALFTACDCTICHDPSKCDCQVPSELKDDHGQKISAYSDNGLFLFRVPGGVEVLECNKCCRCEIACSNRVAQKPRDVGIEIFKTLQRGWAARATCDLEVGKVLGIYTG